MANTSGTPKEPTKPSLTAQVGRIGTDENSRQAADIHAFLERVSNDDRVAVSRAPWDVPTGIYKRGDGTTVYISNPHHFRPTIGTRTSIEAVAGDESLGSHGFHSPDAK